MAESFFSGLNRQRGGGGKIETKVPMADNTRDLKQSPGQSHKIGSKTKDISMTNTIGEKKEKKKELKTRERGGGGRVIESPKKREIIVLYWQKRPPT